MPWLPICVATFFSRGHLGHQPGLVDRVRQRLLAEAVLAHPHGHQRGRGVGVVGRADGHRVDALAHLVEHLAEVGVALGLGKPLLAGVVQRAFVDVADGDHVAGVAGVARIARALAANADAGHGDRSLGDLLSCGANAAGHPKANARDGGRLQEPDDDWCGMT